MSRLARLAAITLGTLCMSACGPSEPEPEAMAPDVRRLTEGQYRNIVADVFGSAIVVGGRFDAPVRTEGLLAVGSRNATVTPGALIQFDTMARSIADQVVSDPQRRFLVPCMPADEAVYDDECANRFVARYGRYLFRRPLNERELEARLAIVRDTTERLGSFSDGLSSALANLLVSPQFLFVTDVVEPDPERPDAVRLDAWSKASRLSFLFWNTAPDNALLAAAERGELHTAQGLERQVERLIASPRFETGVRAFFSDMLGFSEFAFLEKDSVIYPAFGVAAARDAREQTLRTIVDHVIALDADYRDLFVTRKTFMTRTLGLVYRVQVNTPKGIWAPYEFAPDDPRQGIHTQLGFLALNSHPGRSSPTLRGQGIREMLLCQEVPIPPPDVDFSEFNDPDSPNQTARERLLAHSVVPACAGCHKLTDPIGLALENFDGAGQFRETENGVPIDASGDLDDVAFADVSGLGPALRNNAATTTCLVNRLYAYASGHSLATRHPMMAYLEKRFARDGYSVKALMKRIATSQAFMATTTPEPAGQQVAASAAKGT